jgi:hypothetical protein
MTLYTVHRSPAAINTVHCIYFIAVYICMVLANPSDMWMIGQNCISALYMTLQMVEFLL